MASESRSALADIDPRKYQFYQLVELLHRIAEKPDTHRDALPEEEIIRFTARGSLAFPISDLTNLQQNENGQYLLETAFMGLQGSQSPLPGLYLEPLAWEYAQDTPGINHFLDLFNHRSTVLLNRIWRKYRHHITFQPEGRDTFSQRLFALIGLENPSVRTSLNITHGKLLAYAGLLSGVSRSPEILCGLIAHCFDLEDVTINSWQHRYVPVPDDQQTILGSHNSSLGTDIIIGDVLDDCSAKFTLCLNNMSLKQYLRFLPTGDRHQSLLTFVSFIVRDQFAFDLQLTLAPEQLTETHFEDPVTCLLGWTTFIGEFSPEPGVTLCMRE